MSIRELSLSEVDMVSGGDYYSGLMEGMKIYEDRTKALGLEGDWHVIAANDPCLSRQIGAYLDCWGFDGKASLEEWKVYYV